MRVIKARRGSDRANSRLAEAMPEHDLDQPSTAATGSTELSRAQRAPDRD